MLVPLLMGCPFEDEKCPFNDWERITTIEDLIIISPLKDTFQIGDKVTLELVINDSIYFGEQLIGLLNETNDLTPSIIIPQRIGFVNFFNNDLSLIHGKQENNKNKFYLEYCFDDNRYKLSIKTRLEIEGDYWFSGSNDVFFGSVKDCNFYRITTNFKGGENGNRLEFVVRE